MLLATYTETIIFNNNNNETNATEVRTISFADNRNNATDKATTFDVTVNGETITFDNNEAAIDYYSGFVTL